MAKAVINLQKESGGIVKISPVDGTGNTELVLPESGELVTKNYADLKVALAEFTGANQSLAASGYQKLPGGLIIQWGTNNASNNYVYYNLPIAFPNVGLVAVSSHSGENLDACNIHLTRTQIGLKSSSTIQKWLAIGY